MSVPAVLLAMAGLAGCYDLSAPSGPRREDFMADTSGSDPSTDAQGQPAQAERSEQAAMAATKATTASDPASVQHAPTLDANAQPVPAGTELSVAEYVARYIHPAPSAE